MQVVKRNGSLQEFNPDKIKSAIISCFKSVDSHIPETTIDSMVEEIVDACRNTEDITVEKIQDIVEDYLMIYNFFDEAKAYIKYRYTHEESRVIKDRIAYMTNYINTSDNAATSSEEDPNSNVMLKNVANLKGENFKNLNRKLQRRWMKDKLNELYPEVANQYEIDLNNHIIYAHDEASYPVPTNYCEAVTLYPLLIDGTSTMDGLKTTPPKNLNSFCGQLINLTFLLAAQCKGAVAFGEFFNFFDYFCVKDFGENYIENIDQYADSKFNVNRKTIKEKILQAFQQIVYSWNQPAGNRDYQSPFINISYYDSNYWRSLFEDFCFPDGSKPKWERVDYLQKLFMKWFNRERQRTLLTFPVETMSLLTDGKDVIDKNYKEFTAEMWSEGHSFFLYQSDSADNLASCCFSPDTKILWKSSTLGVQCNTLKELEEMKWDPNKKNLRIFHNGFWIKGRPIKTSNTDFYKITTANHKIYYITNNHINVTFDGEKTTENLTLDDYLMFNTNSLRAIPESDEHLTYEQGFAVGAFLGDGSFGARYNNDTIYDINYSQNINKYKNCMINITKANHQLGSENDAILNKVHNNVYPIRISSKKLVAFIQKWTNWVDGTYSYNKELNLDCLLQSEEFRKGILDGWYSTDEGNSNRCYTTSEKLKDCMEILITSLGMNSIIDRFDRTDEKVIIREQEFNRNFPLWCVRWYDPCNKYSMDGVYKWKNNSQFFKIVNIERIENPFKEQYSYCIECTDSANPYFTLPSGLITHNCRLKNEIGKNEFSFTNGLTGVKTGSCNVITLNLNRIVQDFCRTAPKDRDEFFNKDDFKAYLINILERVYKYQIAYKTMLYELEDKGMLTASKAGYIDMRSLFSTIGLNGINEAAEYLGLTCSYNDEYKLFCNLITSTISEQNKLHSSKRFRFNTEFVPAEGLSSKNYNWDKNDGYIVPSDRNLYNSYFYLAGDPNTTVLDRFRLQGREFTATLDGGVGLHCNLSEHLSKEQYLKLIDFSIAEGTSYYTFNIPNSECTDCGNIEKIPITKCPKCGKEHIRQWTRIIGYLRPIEAFESPRKWEAENRRIYSKKLD